MGTDNASHAARLDAVLRLARDGNRLFPCRPADKAPITPRGFHDATTDETQLRAWYERHPAALWATTDALVLDVDVHKGGDDGYSSYRALADENGGDGGAGPYEHRARARLGHSERHPGTARH
jgi:Bifunctional DNA primase/polymerase, N-terminal